MQRVEYIMVRAEEGQQSQANQNAAGEFKNNSGGVEEDADVNVDPVVELGHRVRKCVTSRETDNVPKAHPCSEYRRQLACHLRCAKGQ